VDQILMPFIQPVRLSADAGRPDVARPAAHFPAPAHDAIGGPFGIQIFAERAVA